MGTIWTELAWTALLPMAVAAAVIVIADRWPVRSRAAWALGVGLAYLVGHIANVSRGSGLAVGLAKLVEPREARDWLPPAVLLAMGVTLLATAAPRSWQRWIVGLAAIVCVGVPVRLLANLAAGWSTGEKLVHLPVLAAALAVAWLMLATAHDDGQPRTRAIQLAVVALGTAATIALSGSAMLGQLCGVAAAAIVGASLASSRPAGVAGAAGVLTMSLGGLILLAHYLASLSTTGAALLAAALVAAGGRLPTQIMTGPAWRQTAIRTAISLAALILAVGLAAASRP